MAAIATQVANAQFKFRKRLIQRADQYVISVSGEILRTWRDLTVRGVSLDPPGVPAKIGHLIGCHGGFTVVWIAGINDGRMERFTGQAMYYALGPFVYKVGSIDWNPA